MIKDILFVGAGSFLGGIARYLVTLLMRSCSGSFPWGTFTVNIAGSLLIGLLWGWTMRYSQTSTMLSLFFSVGFCGGFTTFSTFSKESLALIQSGSYTGFAFYVIGSFVCGILAVMAGVFISK